MTNGVKNKVSITMVFVTMLLLACLLMLFVLKYSFTLFLKVFEKSVFVRFENFGFLMLLMILF